MQFSPVAWRDIFRNLIAISRFFDIHACNTRPDSYDRLAAFPGTSDHGMDNNMSDCELSGLAAARVSLKVIDSSRTCRDMPMRHAIKLEGISHNSNDEAV
ncbi:hypothetical protein [Phytohalomonas tamaricis]|uniref:hypothetical protein n=1 Tax=Phytohalomonas tamaricis TaxID=2081032 RepID=UPI001319EA84|nr:hypothetical protein [Phytohalomonas tamaricis]